MASLSARLFGLTFVVSTCFAVNAFADPLEQARELYASGNWDTAKEAYEEVLEQPDLRANAALGLAGIYWEQGSLGKAKSMIQVAEQAATKGKRVDLIGQIRFTRGNILAGQGQFAKAQSELKKCQKSKDATFVILCRISERFVRQLVGKSVPSEIAYKRDLDKLKSTGSPLLVGTALAKAAELRDRNGASADAIALLQQAHAHYQKANSAPSVNRNKLRLAAVYQNAGQWNKSAAELNGVLSAFANMNNRPALVTTYTLLGKQAEQQGDNDKAMQHFNKAKKISKGIGSPQLTAQVDLGLCHLHAKSKHLSKSRSHCEAAFTKFSSIGAWTLAARSKVLFAGVAQERKELTEARNAFREALTILEKRVAKSSVTKRDFALQYANLCQVEGELKIETARETCDKSRRLFGGVAKDNQIYNAMASSEYTTGVLSIGKVAREHFERAARLFEDAGIPARAADSLLRAGKLQPDLAKASKQFERGIALVKLDQERVGKVVRLQLRTQLTQALVGAKSWDTAHKAVDALIEESKNQEAHSTLAWALSARAKVNLKLGNRDAAIRDLTQCVAASKKARDREQRQICDDNLTRLNR